MSSKFFVVATGDSTTAAATTPSWFYRSMGIGVSDSPVFGATTPRVASFIRVGADVTGVNLAQSGMQLSHLIDQATGLSGYFSRDSFINLTPPTGGGRPTIHNILACRIGTNVDETDAAVYAALVRTHYLAAQAAGWLVIDLPPWSRTGKDAFMQALNAIKATWTTSDGVAAVVPATEPLLYGTNAYANTTYFNGDGIHPTTAGHNLAARDFLVTLDALMVSLGALAMPTGLVATSGSSIQIDFTTPAIGAVFRLYRNTADNFQTATILSTITAPTSPTVTTFDDTGVSGTPYFYWVTRYNSTTGEETLPTLSVTATPS